MNANQRDYTVERLKQLEAEKKEAEPKFIPLMSNLISGGLVLTQSALLFMENHIDNIEIATMCCATAIFCISSVSILYRSIKVASLESEIGLLKYSLEMDRLASTPECMAYENRKTKK